MQRLKSATLLRLALWAAFFVVMTARAGCGGLGTMLISEQQEINMGQNAAPQVERQFGGLYRDAALTRYVNKVGRKLARVCDRKNITYRYRIVNSKEVNAFALPGGHIYITRGLLSRLNNEAQLAGVLGHETGHVCARHTVKQIGNAMGLGLVLQAAVIIAASGSKTADAAQAASVAGNVVGSAIMMGFSREDEYEADKLGTKYAYRAGYNPRGMVQTLVILQSLEKTEPGAVENLFRSHPRTRQRVEEVEKDIAEWFPDLESHTELVFNEERFGKETAKLHANAKAYRKYDEAQDCFAQKDYTKAIKLLTEAIEELPAEAPFHDLRAQCYRADKNYPKALEDFEKAMKLDPSDFDANFGYAVENIERLWLYDKAQPPLERCVQLVPSDAGAHFYLAECFTHNRLPADEWRKKAIEHYKVVLAIRGNEYTERAKQRLQELGR